MSKKYLINMEGSNGYPGEDFHDHCVVSEEGLRSTVFEYLMPYIENWNSENKTDEELIDQTIKDNGFNFSNTGYGEELFITIKEV